VNWGFRRLLVGLAFGMPRVGLVDDVFRVASRLGFLLLLRFGIVLRGLGSGMWKGRLLRGLHHRSLLRRFLVQSPSL